MIKVLNARLLDAFRLELDFSNHTQGVFDAGAYLAARSGPLLDKLRDPAYFRRPGSEAHAAAGGKEGGARPAAATKTNASRAG